MNSVIVVVESEKWIVKSECRLETGEEWNHKKESSFLKERLLVNLYDDISLYQILGRDTLVILNTANGFCKHICNRNLLNLCATLGVRDGISEYYLLKS